VTEVRNSRRGRGMTAEEMAALAERVRCLPWKRYTSTTISNLLAALREAEERATQSFRVGVEWQERALAAERALRPFAQIALVRDSDRNGIDAIGGPDLAITPRQVREARAALGGAPHLQRRKGNGDA
jgi:hypothetical protein